MYRTKRAILRILPLIAPWLLACGPASNELDGRAAADGRRAPAADLQPGHEGSVAADGRAQPPADAAPLPASCPCPLDAYCDLNTNRCVAGCRQHEHCSPGKACDPQTERCRPGCRTVADCTDDGNPCTDLACVDQTCTHPPNAAPCADDGESCTADVCSGGACTHPPANEGKPCGATKDCSDFRCSGGKCVEKPFAAGAGCPDDGDTCTSDACDGQGSCAHDTVPDGTECTHAITALGSAKCFGGTCYPVTHKCCGYSTLYYVMSDGKSDTWDGTTGCGCDGKKIWWHGYYSGYYLEHDEYCTSCGGQPGDYCLPCYRQP